MYKLTGKVQHYAWGGTTYIPQLLGINNSTQQPYAEYWMGAHASAPSLVEQNANHHIALNELIGNNPAQWLGEKTAARFGGLPYLFKVLDVKDMLSIQVHPSKTEAEKGFARENEAGVALNAPHRNYKDDNHKPEVMLALSDFWLLHGFKESALLLQTLRETEAFQTLLPVFEKEGHYGLYKQVMELPQAAVDNLLSPLLQEAEPLYKVGRLSKSGPAYWACKTLAANNGNYNNIDRGIFSIYFFNIVQLHPGQAIFQGAGVPHAYLEGQNIELMSNSDNVLRGGLTLKHIDVPELLKHTLFEGIIPQVMNGEKNGAETVYHCPVPDFEVSNITVNKLSAYRHTAFSVEILLITEGEAEITTPVQTLHVKKGEAVLVGASETYTIGAGTKAVLYKAGVPEQDAIINNKP
ncbi:mannose-6-phosphate isomerase, class I [Agriterribacter sp.]|uniref:mannose-6-phosphate isomerase, class I n=1 Tax=Agriterribacter sp. TaxID=2821509 RepID=UPI002C799243|nr:mannose-6-phosphate isomerase, class I [Agriterribacter sp.]HRO46899.1 mannose-6-phosphate isomerase, class I [Agriterribacter sp.]